MSNRRDEATAAERKALRRLAREMEAPDELEENVIRALRRRRLLAVNGRMRWRPGPAGVALAAAASLAALVVGIGIGRSGAAAELPRGSFALFLHAGPAFVPQDAENFPARYAAYNDWVAAARARGAFVTGEQLDGTGRVVIPAGRTVDVEDRLAGGADGDVIAMFLVRADDYEGALALARTLPHLSYGGRVAVRRIDPI